MTTTIVAFNSVIPLTLSGYGLYHEIAGGWREEVHEFIGECLMFLVVTHLAKIAIVSVIRRSNLAKSMITGYAASTVPDLIKSSYKVVMIILLMRVAVWMVWHVFIK